ncbi:MAG: hypothetical protein DI592_22175, partial [Stenotrophomonas maltophilia]
MMRVLPVPNWTAGPSALIRSSESARVLPSMRSALINSVQVDAGESLEELPNLIADAQRAIGELQDRQFTFPHLLDPEQVQRDWLTIRTEVIPVFRSLPDNTDRKFTRETMQQARDKIAHYQGHVD